MAGAIEVTDTKVLEQQTRTDTVKTIPAPMYYWHCEEIFVQGMFTITPSRTLSDYVHIKSREISRSI